MTLTATILLFVAVPESLHAQWIETIIPDVKGALGYNPVDNKVYGVDSARTNLVVIDGTSNTIIDSIVGDYPPMSWTYNSINHKIYCGTYTGTSNDIVAIIDCSTDSVITTIVDCTHPASMVYNHINNRVYVAVSGHDAIKVIDGVTNVVKWGQISTCYMRSLFSSYANCYVECRDLTPYEA
jgi:DNA-binding beta-propeller fold protein YncE